MTILEKKVKVYYIHKQLFNVKFDTEAKLLSHAKDMLGMLGALVIREAHATKNGTSDLIICYKGRFIAAELKDDRGTPSVQQIKFISKVQAAGGNAAVVATLAQLFELLMAATDDPAS